jgi:hypothetical protein
MIIRAVLTGDIVNSTTLNAARDKKLTHSLIDIFSDQKMEFFRGDSFQAYIQEPKQALRLALLARVSAIRLFKDDNTVLSDVRISIGIGSVKSPVRALKTAKGEAFILSGRQFDEISKSHQRLAITAANPLANEGLLVIADYLNAIFDLMTGKQAEVIFELLNGEMQKTVAKKFKKTKSTIHQRTTSGRWPEIEKLLLRYENIINQLT